MNRKIDIRWWAVLLVLGCVMSGYAASFGTGVNAFELTFQPISGETNPSSGYGQVAYDYGIGTYEITADQWVKYINSNGEPDGRPYAPPTTSGSQAVNNDSWDEAAQFVNWLNTSSGYAPAYNFDAEGTFSLWDVGEQSATSAYRHKDAIYVLPSEDEWTKAAYWNGSEMQTYSTPGDSDLSDMNVNINGDAVWEVGSGGSVELNGTYDMMGNVWEWNESAFDGTDNVAGETRVIRGGAFYYGVGGIGFDSRRRFEELTENDSIGFRVAAIPEPASLALIGLFGGGVLFIRRIFMM